MSDLRLGEFVFPSYDDVSQLLEQASDLNDELCRENCDLHREVSLLRERRWAQTKISRVDLLTRVVSAVNALELPADLRDELGETLRRKIDVGDLASEEKAALINEKAQLQELSLLQQERLLELDLRRNFSDAKWASRLTSVFREGEHDQEKADPEPEKPVVGGEYEVVGRKGAILRESEDLDSNKVATLPPGCRIVMLELGSSDFRRARVCAGEAPEGEMPPMGWLSVVTKDGRSLVRPVVQRGLEEVAAPGEADGRTEAPETDEAKCDVAVDDSEVSGASAHATEPKTDTVTVSTDAWLALRNERNQREDQIKTLEAQIKVAQRELDIVGLSRSEIRKRREEVSCMRERHSRLHEAALMARAEIEQLRVETQRFSQTACLDPQCSSRDVSPKSSAQDEEQRRTHIEWRRLLSERETTAMELGNQLGRIEELEETLEERRIEFQIAERRREQERNSLTSVLREFGWDGAESYEAVPQGQQDLQSAKDRVYIQQISELEELCEMLRHKLDWLLARETALNRSATVRGAALRHAVRGSRLAEVSDDRHFDRADLEGLTSMLEGLYVENVTLQSQKVVSRGLHPGSRSTVEANPSSPLSPRVSFDLSAFIREDADASDGERSPRPEEPSFGVAVERPVLSPRSLLLDFNTISVAE